MAQLQVSFITQFPGTRSFQTSPVLGYQEELPLCSKAQAQLPAVS